MQTKFVIWLRSKGDLLFKVKQILNMKNKNTSIGETIKQLLFSKDERYIITYSISYVLFLLLFANVTFLDQFSMREAIFYKAFFSNQGCLTSLLANVGIIFLLGWDYVPQKNGAIRAWDMVGLLVLVIIAILIYAHAHHQIAEGTARKAFLEYRFWGPTMYGIFTLGLMLVKCRLMYRSLPMIAHDVK